LTGDWNDNASIAAFVSRDSIAPENSSNLARARHCFAVALGSTIVGFYHDRDYGDFGQRVSIVLPKSFPSGIFDRNRVVASV
jgi:hypothetical protein